MKGGGGRRKMVGAPPSNRSKERDEDLLLFRDMHKRQKDRVVTLLQPVSDEFEPTGGNYALYRMASAKKGPGGGGGVEFLGESEKNDYDWLKTPPATPLFPSLEMESNAPQLVVQREIPIMQPLSRFAGTPEASTSAKSKFPNPKPKVPVRSITPSGGRPSEKKNSKSAPTLRNQKTANQQLSTLSSGTKESTDVIKKSNAVSSSSSATKESHLNLLASNLSKSRLEGIESTKTKPKSRGVSPLGRSTIVQITGFSDETPPNLKTDRSASASRGRSTGNQNQTVGPKQSESNLKSARSVSRGRKVAAKQATRTTTTTTTTTKSHDEEETNNMALAAASGRRIQTGYGAQVLGSRMVDKFLNARKSSAEERETKPILYGSLNESSGFGRMMAKTSLHHTPLNHTEVKREAVNFRNPGMITGRKPAAK